MDNAAVLDIEPIMGIPLGSLIALAYFVVPLIAAAVIFDRGALDALAFLMLLTDRLPAKDRHAVRFEVEAQGAPTTASALLRLLYSLPEAFMLMLLGIPSFVAWLFASVCVLFTGRYPRAIFNFNSGVLRFVGRLFAYHASLVADYPPLTLQAHTTA